MTVVHDSARLSSAVVRARRSAARAFGSEAIYFERFVEGARHVEVQVLGDAHSALVQLGDRECSVQRRHQKVIEEAPAPGLSPTLRRQMAEIALRAAAAVGYVGAGTVEFLVSSEEDFYFLEMNARLQVEHPVTEEITGQDLVEWQLRVAAGEPLPLRQDAIDALLDQGRHAIECRLYAEDPHSHLPTPGTISAWRMPGGEGVRVDAGVTEGTTVTLLYDPLLAKIIIGAPDRRAAITRMQAALDAAAVEGTKTNLPLLRRVVHHDDFVEGRYSTDLLSEMVASP
jgi:acetyl/propionyl-CoA carboxylase alpha subunit